MNVVDLMHYYKSNGIIINKKKNEKKLELILKLDSIPLFRLSLEIGSASGTIKKVCSWNRP